MTKIEDKFTQAIGQAEYDKIGSLIHQNCGSKITLTKIEELAKTLKCNPLQRAVSSCKKMAALSNTMMSEKELLEVAFFIETKLKAHINKKKYYLKSTETGLSRTVEHDPENKFTFIHLKCHNGAEKLGKGVFKTVTKSILYDREKPEIVAHAELKGNAEQEVKNLKQAKGLHGVIQAKSITSHKATSTGEKKVSMVFARYNPGALSDAVIKELSFKEKLKVAHDLLVGLTDLHKVDIVHRDLKSGNVFIDKNQNGVEAVISDLGQGLNQKLAKGKIPNATVRYSPPEALNADLQKIDYKKCDLFSLGVIFYEILFKKQPQWMADSLISEGLHSKDLGKKKITKKLFKEHIEKVQKRLKEKSDQKKKGSKKALFMQTISAMIEPNCAKRPTASELLHKFKVL